MKRFALLAFLALMLSFSTNTWTVFAADTAPTRSITVTGDADVRVVPDEVVFVFGVEIGDPNLTMAKNQNDARVAQVINKLKSMGIDQKYIQTDRINIEPRYKDTYMRTDVIGFVVRKTIAVILNDVSKFDDVLTSSLDLGVTNVQNIDFRTTELRKYRDQARTLAIQAAREKAEAMSKELGMKVGKPVTIREEYSNWWSSYSWRWDGGSMSQNVVQNAGGNPSVSDDSSFAPGQITINARVSVTFEIE
jgi:uncharacterized protein YggE